MDQETSGLPNGAGEIEGAGDTSWRLKMRVWKRKIELQNSFFFGVFVLLIYGSFSASRMFRSNIYIYLSQKKQSFGEPESTPMNFLFGFQIPMTTFRLMRRTGRLVRQRSAGSGPCHS